jgi:hypothetical protein
VSHLKSDCSIPCDIRHISISGSPSDSVSRTHQELFEWEKMVKIFFRTMLWISHTNASSQIRRKTPGNDRALEICILYLIWSYMENADL